MSQKMFCVLCLVVCFLFFRHLLEKFQIPNLNSRSIVVTGCDTGLGHDLVLKLLHNGMTVFAGCFTEYGKENLKYESAEYSGTLETFELDVTNLKSVNEAVKFVQSKTKDLWAIVNNAGILGFGMTDWLQISDYQKCLDVNTLGVIRVTEAFKPMIKKSKGRIITITSQAGRIATIPFGCYAVSKFATEGYCDTLRLEMIPFGVSVHIIQPGLIVTPMISKRTLDNLSMKSWNNASQEIRDEYGEDFLVQMVNSRHKAMSFASTKKSGVVIDSLYHAITAVFPRRRYSPDFISKWSKLCSILPTFWQDKILLLIEVMFPKPKKCSA